MTLSEFYNNKVVLITGSSMGIGKELARQVLQAGGKVVITGRNEARLNSVKEEFKNYPDNLLVVRGDVACYEEDINMVKEILLRFGKLDVLINNAGISAYGDLVSTSREVVDELINTNIRGSLYATMASLPELRKTKGAVIFISSIAGLRGIPGYSLYSLTKMSLTALVQSLKTENKKYGIFTGITYIGFTENEAGKKTLSPEGRLEKIPVRPGLLTSSRPSTAAIILRQIIKRKNVVVHSFTGKMTCLFNRYLPFLVNLILAKNYISSTRKES